MGRVNTQVALDERLLELIVAYTELKARRAERRAGA